MIGNKMMGNKMKKQPNLAGISLAFALIALMLSGCSKAPPPPPPTTTQTETRNMSPDDTVKTHMQQMQQNGGGNK